jgi:YgiT-type zinc finger domain-containing protein
MEENSMQSAALENVDVEIEIGGSLQTCANCGSADVCGTTVRSAFWHGDRLVVVDDIPALVCQSCGEQYYGDQTVVRLDLLRGTGFPADQAEAEMIVPVFSLRNKQSPAGRDEAIAGGEAVRAEPTG